jgi:hypothetical protein
MKTNLSFIKYCLEFLWKFASQLSTKLLLTVICLPVLLVFISSAVGAKQPSDDLSLWQVYQRSLSMLT